MHRVLLNENLLYSQIDNERDDIIFEKVCQPLIWSILRFFHPFKVTESITVFLHFASTAQGPAERNFVGIFQITTDR